MHRCEPLESRCLFDTTWADYAQLVHQDTAATQFSNLTGQGETIAIIDSGINYNDPNLGGGFGPGFKVEAGYDFADNDNDPMDTTGHGTAVAGVIAATPFDVNGIHYQGAAPDAKLIALRVDNGDPQGISTSNIERALDWIVANYQTYSIDAVNISIGDGSYTTPFTDNQLSPDYVKLANLNIPVFAASGNDGSSGVAFSAADPNVAAIGSINASDQISTFTQRGPLLDLLAPGEAIVTPNKDGGFSSFYGTSFASPYVVGTAALIEQADPGISHNDLLSILRASGTPVKDPQAGGLIYPRLDMLAALQLAEERKTSSANTVGGLAGASSEVFDAQGILHLAYYDKTIDSIRYATRDTNGQWSATQIVDSSGADVGVNLSIALDSTGKPGIAYFDNTNSDLKYASFDGSSWHVQTLDSSKSVGQTPSLVFDSNNLPWIAYWRKSSADLKVATLNSSNAWKLSTIDSTGDVGQWASIAIAADGTIGIGYADNTNGDLKYASFANNTWTTTVADDLTGSVAYVNLVEHNNHAYITYQDLAAGDLKMARFDGPDWKKQTIFTPGNTGQFTNLYVDSTNHAHILFYSKSKNLIYQAVGTFGAWKFTTISTGGMWLSAAASDDALTYFSLDANKKNLKFGSIGLS